MCFNIRIKTHMPLFTFCQRHQKDRAYVFYTPWMKPSAHGGTCFRAGGQFLISEKRKRRKRKKEWAPAGGLMILFQLLLLVS